MIKKFFKFTDVKEVNEKFNGFTAHKIKLLLTSIGEDYDNKNGCYKKILIYF